MEKYQRVPGYGRNKIFGTPLIMLFLIAVSSCSGVRMISKKDKKAYQEHCCSTCCDLLAKYTYEYNITQKEGDCFVARIKSHPGNGCVKFFGRSGPTLTELPFVVRGKTYCLEGNELTRAVSTVHEDFLMVSFEEGLEYFHTELGEVIMLQHRVVLGRELYGFWVRRPSYFNSFTLEYMVGVGWYRITIDIYGEPEKQWTLKEINGKPLETFLKKNPDYSIFLLED